MSCHLRSRNTRTPRAANSRTSAGPSRTYSTGPIFAHARPGRRSARARASRPLGRSNATTSSATGQLARDALGNARIGERGGPDRDERCTRVEILARLVRRADPTHADHGDVHALAHAPGREHADRQERGPAHAAPALAEPPPERPRNPVDQADRVPA